MQIVFGMQWGDEGKGKAVDALGESNGLYVRVNGGPNAGHTVGQQHANQVPPGFRHESSRMAIAAGSVVDIPALEEEIRRLGINPGRVYVDPRAHVLERHHRTRDAALVGSLGTTGSGNGPVHADKYARVNSRVEDHAEALRRCGVNVEPVTPLILQQADHTTILVAHGTMLDINFGTYPHVTSSHCTADSAYIGTGVPSTVAARRIGVLKPYATRSAQGLLRGEFVSDEFIERGVVSGRRRRTGLLDLGQLRYAAQINQPDSIILNKADIMANKPVWVITSAWGEPEIREQLPPWPIASLLHGEITEGLIDLIAHIEVACRAPVIAVGYGPGRSDYIWR